MEQRALTDRRLLAALAAAVLVVVVGATLWIRAHRAPPGTRRAVSTLDVRVARVPDSVRIEVEVLNASGVPGLARRATFLLRDAGFDVVDAGNARERRDSTLVLDRTGHPDWARLAARAMGGAPVAERPDTSRYVDVSVLIGKDWRPPPEPFYP